jgi:hypothetical protein
MSVYLNFVGFEQLSIFSLSGLERKVLDPRKGYRIFFVRCCSRKLSCGSSIPRETPQTQSAEESRQPAGKLEYMQRQSTGLVKKLEHHFEMSLIIKRILILARWMHYAQQ